MSWLNSIINKNKSQTIQVKILKESEKSYQVEFGIHTTHLPKSQIKIKENQ